MAKLGDLVAVIGANTKPFNKAMNDMQRKTKYATQGMEKFGKSMSLAVSAPIALMTKSAIENFDKQAKAVAQVEQGLKSTGGAVGFTSEQLQKMASDLQKTSLFGDEEIMQGATAQLLTFTNIAGDQFARTQKAAMDLATRLDGDLKSSSIQLGKALNDPVAFVSCEIKLPFVDGGVGSVFGSVAIHIRLRGEGAFEFVPPFGIEFFEGKIHLFQRSDLFFREFVSGGAEKVDVAAFRIEISR